jgi:hypothetical protein
MQLGRRWKAKEGEADRARLGLRRQGTLRSLGSAQCRKAQLLASSSLHDAQDRQQDYLSFIAQGRCNILR